MRTLRTIIAGFALLILASVPSHAVDSLLLPFTLDRCTDTNGSPQNACTATVYDAGTTTLKSVFTDSALTSAASNPIVADSDGWFSPRYIGTGDYKVLFEKSNGVDIKAAIDDLPGATDTSAFAPTSAAPEVSIITKTSAYTVQSTDLGKCINVNPTGGAFTLTLISAATAGDGKTLCIRHVGTANQVTIATVSSQTINHFSTGGASRTTWPLTQENQSIWLVSDGANWHVLAAVWGPSGQHYFQVEDDGLSSPPASPTAGAWYIVAASPTGDWSTFAQHDLVQANGAGGWLKLTPAAGWRAYVKDETKDHLFYGSAWVALPNTDSPNTSNTKYAIYTRQLSDGSNGGSTTSTSWVRYPLTTEVADTIGASISTEVVTLPTGTYCVDGAVQIQDGATSRLRLRNTTDNATAVLGINVEVSTSTEGTVPILGCFAVDAATETFELQYFVENGKPSNGLGSPSSESGSVEVYGTIKFVDLASLQGPIGPSGPQGSQGAAGLSGLSYTYSNTTTMADPGAGLFRLNNGTLASVTAIAIDDTTAESGNPDLSAYINTWDDSGSTVKGVLRVVKAGATQNIAVYTVSGLTDNSGWSELAVTHVASSGSFSDTDDIKVEFIRTGDVGTAGLTGATGAAGPTIATAWNFSTTTADSDPGSGVFRLNNATPASATKAFFDNNERGGADVSAYIDTWDDDGDASNRGTLLLIDPSDSTIFHIFSVTGTVVDDSGYRDVTISHIAGNGTFTDTNETAVMLMMAGPATASNSFETINTPAGTNPVAESATDTLNITAGTGVTITGTAGTDTVDFSLDAEISAFAGLTSAADQLPYYTGSGAAALTGLTATGRSIIDDANIAAAQVTLQVVGVQTIWIPGGGMTAAVTSGATPETREIGTPAATKPTFSLMSFPTSADTYAQFGFKMPKGSNEGGNFTYEVVWTADAGTATQTVHWKLACTGFGNDDTLNSTFSTEAASNDALIATDDLHRSPESSAFTVANAAEGDYAHCRLRRDTTDTLSDDAQVIGIAILYPTNAATDD